MPLSSAYASTKFALEGLSESIRYELNEFGINVIVIESGVIKTNFVENSEAAHHTSNSESAYVDLIERAMKGFGELMKNSSLPKLVADCILNALTSKEPQIRYLVGDDAQSIMKVRKSTSDKEFENWMYESVLQNKGFVREVAAGQVTGAESKWQ